MKIFAELRVLGDQRFVILLEFCRISLPPGIFFYHLPDSRRQTQCLNLQPHGSLIEFCDISPPHFAVGFVSEKANGIYHYMWLFKVRAKPVTETDAAKEGTSITRQTSKVEWTAIKRTSDGRYQAVADDGENGFAAEKAQPP